MALARFSPGARRGLIIAGALILALGLILMVLFLVQFAAGFSAVASGDMPQLPNVLLGFAAFPVVFIGIAMLALGSRKTMAELHATDVGPATEHLAHAVGSGLRSSGLMGHQPVKVRCLHCGGLDTEDAAFCSHCGKPLRAAPGARP